MTDFASSSLSLLSFCPPHPKAVSAQMIWPCIAHVFTGRHSLGGPFGPQALSPTVLARHAAPIPSMLLKKHVLTNHSDLTVPDKIVTELSCLFEYKSFAFWPHGITVILTFAIIPLLVSSRLPIAWFTNGMLLKELYFYCYCVDGII